MTHASREIQRPSYLDDMCHHLKTLRLILNGNRIQPLNVNVTLLSLPEDHTLAYLGKVDSTLSDMPFFVSRLIMCHCYLINRLENSSFLSVFVLSELFSVDHRCSSGMCTFFNNFLLFDSFVTLLLESCYILFTCRACAFIYGRDMVRLKRRIHELRAR